ncbi:MAG: hypothetical protein BGO96_13300 [Micrococcales bacterium 73-15]|uniref:S1C family serine protease n=1 Tax=Salana multivorans TaxID=120377 RepID=UPI00095F3929|nr:trypsin-like peptidase domain-containing protein [Salana multivorans]OJX97887.1 MAG: hypothetical protein BGO96_13300 [Micrococcales bacterium 73-15]
MTEPDGTERDEPGGLEAWPWPTPEELARQDIAPSAPSGPDESGAGVGTPAAPADDPTGAVTPGAPRARRRAPRRHRTARRGVGGAVVAVVGVLALLVGTLGGLLLAPWFGIEAATSGAPAPSEPPTGLGPSPSAEPSAPEPQPEPEQTELPDTPLPDTLPLAPGGPIDPGARIDVVDIAARALPSTVSIQVRQTDGSGSSGSGFVIREDGFILTNAHVVAGSDADGATLTILYADGEQSTGTVVGITHDYDLAVVSVDRTDVPALPLADSDGVVVGQEVVAVGAPLGLQGTVTAGIVSALNRPVQAGDASSISFINAIQTDAAINPGNSGGPLLDASGAVIGINSAIAQASGGQQATGSIGLGFAIPSNQARRTAEQLIAHGYATYPVIGVLLDSSWVGVGVKVSTQPTEDGVQPLTAGGPAEQAGIRPGDVIVAIDSRPVTAPDELIVAIRAHAPGDTVVLTIRDDDVDRDVPVVLGEERSR